MPKKPVEVFDDPEAFRRAAAGKSKAKAKGKATTTTPRAPAGEGDMLGALMRLSAHGFMPRWRAGAGHDFWHIDGRTTTAYESYADAVRAAEKELS